MPCMVLHKFSPALYFFQIELIATFAKSQVSRGRKFVCLEYNAMLLECRQF